MKLNLLIVGLFLLSFMSIFSAEQKTASLPKEWIGHWKGTLKITPTNEKASNLPMELIIEPQKGSANYSWTIVYGEGASKQTRNYELKPVADKPNAYQIDEKNGIVIDALMAGSTLFSQFQVSGNLLTARYELRGGKLIFEITMYNAASPRSTGNKNGAPEVLSYELKTVQIAALERLKK